MKTEVSKMMEKDGAIGPRTPNKSKSQSKCAFDSKSYPECDDHAAFYDNESDLDPTLVSEVVKGFLKTAKDKPA